MGPFMSVFFTSERDISNDLMTGKQGKSGQQC
jgi:hypothetical protein